MASCNPNRLAFLSANATISFPSAMPAAVPGLGIITSSARPCGCHLSESGRTPPMLLISGNAALILRAARIVLTCRPRSGATPTDSSCGASRLTTRHRDALDADTISPGPELTLDKAHDDGVGAATVICDQHGATSPATESAAPRAATGWALPPTAKSMATGPTTTATTTGDLRRSLANRCRPTASTLRANQEIVTIR
jgi:hypothetical protein